MKRLREGLGTLPLGWRAALTFALLLAVSYVLGGHALGGVTMAMIIIPWSPALDRDQLEAAANPMYATQPEVVPWQLYDTQSITTAVNAPAVYFQTINADKTLSNMEGPGQLPDPQYLVVHYVAADFLIAPQSTAVGATTNNAAVDDIENILKTVRGTFEFNMSNKRYGPFSLTMCHATGGTTGSLYGVGTLAAAVSGGVANNGIPGSGGFPFSGALVIPPKIGFDVTVRMGAAPTLPVSPLSLRISLVGALYRRVL